MATATETNWIRVHDEAWIRRTAAGDLAISDEPGKRGAATVVVAGADVVELGRAIRMLGFGLSRPDPGQEDGAPDDPNLPDEVDVLRGQVKSIALMLADLQELVEELQKQQAPTVMASDFATKDFVDQAIRRLNGALRDHIRKVFENALRASAPGPGVVQRVWDALKPGASTWHPEARAAAASSQAVVDVHHVTAITPDLAVALGAAAARKAVEG